MITRLDQVSELLRTEDIEGLVEIGAPGDEYESEAEMITDRIAAAESASPNGRITKADAIRIIREVWAEMFSLENEDLSRRQDAFEHVAALLAL
jgi:hypothetical protein